MRKSTIFGLLALGIGCAASPAMADVPAPWGFPECANADDFKLGDKVRNSERGFLPKPYVSHRNVYTGIYLAVEAYATLFAASLYPDLVFDEHRNWVVISRSDRRGKKEGETYTFKGSQPQIAYYPGPRVSMRIDKCDGTISQLRIHTK